MKKISFKIYTLGCKVNQYDSKDLGDRLAFNGLDMVENNADLAIINTCCVTKTAIHKCKRMINRARMKNHGAKIAVMGCWPRVYEKEVKKIGVDFIFGKGELDEFIKKFLKINTQSGIKPESGSEYPKPSSDAPHRSRYFIKVQDGCEQFCSYCIIPYTRGKLRSRLMDDVIDEIKRAVQDGYQEIVLCGIHLGLYGREQQKNNKNKTNLVLLLKEIIKIKNLGRIRLSSIEAAEVSDELIRLIADSKKICRHLHIPLQSGSDKILKLMNRPYDVEFFRNKIGRIRKLMPNAAVTTDVIAGFPGETKKDFQDTYDFIKEARFSRLHVFPFSAHEKTPAARMPDRVEKEEVERRAVKLRSIGKKLEEEYKKKFIKENLEIVVENVIRNKIKGKTEFYFDIEFPKSRVKLDGEEKIVGRIIKI